MTADSWAAELRRFDPEIPIERAETPPASWYTSAEFLEHERRRVFRRSWQAAGRADQASRPGDYFTGSLGGQPFVVVRDGEGRLRAFFNVCRHHAARVVEGEGRAEALVCPYHGWTYGLDGSLRRAPRMRGIEEFHREKFGLRPLALEAWGPILFLNAGADPPPLGRILRGLESRLPPGDLAALRFAGRREYRLRCNWKVYVDNYLDGGYHVAHLHGGLAGRLDLDDYRTDLAEWFSVQSCRARSSPGDPAGADFSERIGSGAVYAWIYPNFMLNRYGPILDTNLVVPLAPEETLVVFDYYFRETEGRKAERFIERSLAASHAVQEEDVRICESVQEGLRSAAFDRGVYAPRVETAAHHFHRLLAADLRREG